MRNLFYFFAFAFLLSACSNDDDARNRNPYLIDTNFSVRLSPIQVQDLQFPSNAVYVSNAGLKGVYVINTGSGVLAWEASDPNHVPNSCSLMERNGIELICQCDDTNTYNLFTGQSSGEVLEFTLLQYRVNQNGDNITISN